jgi:hypothetical protein
MAVWTPITNDQAGACFTQEMTGQTTKYTKHTKRERLTKRTRLARQVSLSVVPDVRNFGYFDDFVVPTAPSPGRPRPRQANQSHINATAKPLDRQGIATSMRPQSHPKATSMRP